MYALYSERCEQINVLDEILTLLLFPLFQYYINNKKKELCLENRK